MTMQAHDTLATLIGFIGVGLLLLAFVLNLAKILKAESLPYLALNFIGAALACASSWMIDFMPFVLLEGVWAVATLVALVRVVSGRATQPRTVNQKTSSEKAQTTSRSLWAL
jgi:hypothetical protein